MADSINKYASEAEYTSASHGSTPEVSKVLGSVSPVRYDGRNTDTTGSPSVGDAVYLDPDDNVRFINGKTLVPAELDSNWYPVGVVIKRNGRCVRIRYKNAISYTGFIICKAYKLSNQTSNTISFTVPVNASSTITLSDTFTATKSLSTNPTGFIAELDTWLRSHQPDENGRGGAKLSWHAEYIGETPYIICDSFVPAKEISTTGMTSSWTRVYPLFTDPMNAFKTNANAWAGSFMVLWPERIIKNQDGSATVVPTANVNPYADAPVVTETAFNTSEYCADLRSTWGTYDKYIWSHSLKWPAHDSIIDTWYNVSLKISREMGSHTVPNLAGDNVPYYRSINRALTPDTGARKNAVNAAFNWYYPGLIETYEYYYPRLYSVTDDPVFSTLVKIGSNETTLAQIQGSNIITNCFKNSNVPWLASKNGCYISYWGYYYDLWHMSHKFYPFADYDLTGRT